MLAMTRKDAKESCTLIFQCPYGDDNGVLRWNAVEVGCNRGIYGWNWTLYKVQGNNAGIVSGYRSFPAGCVYLSKKQIDELRKCKSPENMCKLVYKWVQEYRAVEVQKELEGKAVTK